MSPPTSTSSTERSWLSPSPSAVALRHGTEAGSATITRSTKTTPSPNRSCNVVRHPHRQPGLADAAGAATVTNRFSSNASARAATSCSRRTKEVNGSGRAVRGRAGPRLAPGPSTVAAAEASARRSATCSLRSSEDTWLSTVRTEMNRRSAISAFVRCSDHRLQHLGLARR